MGAFSGDIVTGWLLKSRDFGAATTFWASAALFAGLLAASLWRAGPREAVAQG
jgi:OPA family glycerol-3-phosphate transporter-like MFS transporter